MIKLGELEDQTFRERRKKEERYREMRKKKRHDQRRKELGIRDNKYENKNKIDYSKRDDDLRDDIPTILKQNDVLVENTTSPKDDKKNKEKEEDKKNDKDEDKKKSPTDEQNLPELIELGNNITSNREILKRKRENLKASAEQNRDIVAQKRANRLKNQAAAAELRSGINNFKPQSDLLTVPTTKRKYSYDDSSTSSFSLSTDSATSIKKPRVDGEDESEDSDPEPEDNIKLWEPGWKERYYKNKFGVEISDIAFRNKVVEAYTEGLCWVLKYYYQGCQSWNWYYPYHYSPFASDYCNIKSFSVKFKLGEPFKPFEQLMGVLPAASGSHIPKAFRHLMTDEDSDILEYYPEEFRVDLNGKKYSWQGVAILPFIDEKKLLKALEPYYPQLTEEEKERNSRSYEILYVDSSNLLYDTMESLYKNKSNIYELNKDNSRNLNGSLEALKKNYYLPGDVFISPLKDFDLPDIKDIQTIGYILN